MENVTSPAQIVFLGILFLVACVLIGWFLLSVPKDAPRADDESTVDLMKRAGHEMMHWRPVAMSSEQKYDAPENDTVPPVVATFTTAKQPIVTPNNEYSSGLSDSGRVQFEATAKGIAAMYQKGVITNLSKAICAAYGCTVQSAAKPDSTYQMALKAVNRHLPQKDAPQYRLTPEQEATREALGLQ